MGWLSRIFGREEEEKANESGDLPLQEAVEQAGFSLAEGSAEEGAAAEPPEEGGAIPPERVGLDGTYDQSGLAKRVVRAFDNDPDTDDIETIWVAQLSSTVVLKGSVPSEEDLERLVAIASEVEGATDVNTDEVEVAA